MNFNFELILFCAILLTGAIALVDIVFFARKRKSQKLPVIIDYARSFFPVLILVFAVRSFAFEPNHIPTGSLKPTLLVGDFILVNKFDYGIRLPVIHKKIFSISEPQRGDIVVFREPPTETRNLIKRVIGLPGDRVSYKNKVLYINGKEIPQQFKQNTIDHEDSATWKVLEKQENLLGVVHHIYQIPTRGHDDFDVVVPGGEIFYDG